MRVRRHHKHSSPGASSRDRGRIARALPGPGAGAHHAGAASAPLRGVIEHVPRSEARSYYAATAGPRPTGLTLAGDLGCDVAVVGGGIAGISAALNLAERGFDVVLLEAERIGAGASGRSGGQVLPGYACALPALARLVSAADLGALWALSCAAVELTRARIARHAIACDWRDGHVDVALKPRQRRELATLAEQLARDFGYDRLELLDGAALEREIASPRYLAGLYDPGAGHLHPLNYTLGLARAAEAAGVRLYEHAEVRAVERGPRPRLRLDGAVVDARYLVLAQNCARPALVPALGRKIMPVGTWNVATEPLDAGRAAALLPRDACVTDVNFVLDYFRLSADRRLLFGGRVSYSGIEPPRLAASMRARMLRVFPQLADVAIDYVWGGEVDISMNRAPHFGTLDGTLLFAQGFSGHGMALTALAGALMAEAIAGQAGRFDVFARIPHRDFPGGPWLRTPALVLAMLYYRLRALL
jgi:gamma-glutamylputrescine oxidase